MALPRAGSPSDWLRHSHVDAVVEHLRAYARDHEGMDLDWLGRDPYGALDAHPTLTVEHSDEPTGECAVFGHYRPDPPTIHVVRASTYGRDHFTLLHEYAHHLQQHDEEWADIEWRIKPETLRLRITEAIANDFASKALIPAEALAHVSPIPSARQIADLHQSVCASRQAAIVRVTRAATIARASLTTSDPFFVSLVDTEGTVVFSQMIGDDLVQPPRDSHQPDMKRLFDTALTTEGRAAGVASHGITYTSGAARLDVRLDLQIAYDGGYAFVVGTPEHRYGTQRWAQQVHMCPSAACETEFAVTAEISRCPTCQAPRCPECGACDCDAEALVTCSRCFTTLSEAEQRAGLTDHQECPW